ncbi:hypothetical protein PR048_028092 [Dryococelus australis]|uniref:Uncharacterized protein n=1 Tax=Dryococelus australis TaxID=614101 RepID=A0ABQ9GIA0_9NEOP|nr:hypothetical protein PR048_028092 [Dryococelus australis]
MKRVLSCDSLRIVMHVYDWFTQLKRVAQSHTCKWSRKWNKDEVRGWENSEATPARKSSVSAGSNGLVKMFVRLLKSKSSRADEGEARKVRSSAAPERRAGRLKTAEKPRQPSGIVWQDTHMRESGIDAAGNRTPVRLCVGDCVVPGAAYGVARGCWVCLVRRASRTAAASAAAAVLSAASATTTAASKANIRRLRIRTLENGAHHKLGVVVAPLVDVLVVTVPLVVELGAAVVLVEVLVEVVPVVVGLGTVVVEVLVEVVPVVVGLGTVVELVEILVEVVSLVEELVEVVAAIVEDPDSVVTVVEESVCAKTAVNNFSQKVSDFTTMQQPMEKRRRIQYVQNCEAAFCIRRVRAGRAQVLKTLTLCVLHTCITSGKSVRTAARQLQLPRSTVHKVLRMQLRLHSYKVHLVQALQPDDARDLLATCCNTLAKMTTSSSELTSVTKQHFMFQMTSCTTNLLIWINWSKGLYQPLRLSTSECWCGMAGAGVSYLCATGPSSVAHMYIYDSFKDVDLEPSNQNSPHFSFIGSQDLVVKSRPNLETGRRRGEDVAVTECKNGVNIFWSPKRIDTIKSYPCSKPQLDDCGFTTVTARMTAGTKYLRVYTNGPVMADYWQQDTWHAINGAFIVVLVEVPSLAAIPALPGEVAVAFADEGAEVARTRSDGAPGVSGAVADGEVGEILPEESPSTALNYVGATVAERLACSSPTKAIRAQSPAGSHWIFACGYRARQCRWSAGFLWDLTFPPPFHSDAVPYSPLSPSKGLSTEFTSTTPCVTDPPLDAEKSPRPTSRHLRLTSGNEGVAREELYACSRRACPAISLFCVGVTAA